MITLQQYFGDKEHTQEHIDNATLLLERVDELVSDAVDDGAFDDDGCLWMLEYGRLIMAYICFKDGSGTVYHAR